MAEFLAPGVKIDEIEAPPGVVGTPGNVAAFIGLTEKGPTDKPLSVTSTTEYQSKYGGYFKLEGQYRYTPLAVRSYFANGGQRAYIQRIAPSDAATATGSVEQYKYAESPAFADAASVSAVSVGQWGNNVSLSIQKTSCVISGAFASGSPVNAIDDGIILEDINSLEIGDIVYINSSTGLGKYYGVVTGFDTSGVNPKVYLLYFDSPASVSIANGDLLYTSTTHRFKSQTVAAIDTTSTPVVTNGIKVTKNSASTLTPGQVLCVISNDTTSPRSNTVFFYVVTSVITVSDGDVIYGSVLGTKLGSKTSIEIGSTVTSLEFNIKVYEKGFLVESHTYLSTSSTNLRDFVGGEVGSSSITRDGRLFGANSESNRVSFRLKDIASDSTPETWPITLTPLVLNGGSDGTFANVTASIYQAGIDLTNQVHEITIMSAPDAPGSVSVQDYLADSAEADGKRVAIIDPALTESEGIDSVSDIKNWKNTELNKPSSYAALYWPWVFVSDPALNNGLTTADPNSFLLGYGLSTVKVPPSGVVSGQYSLAVATRDIHKSPANIPLKGVYDVTRRITDTEHDILNPEGINAIRVFSGEGIRIYGSRTLYPVANGFHYVAVRQTFNYVKRDLEKINRPFVHQPNDIQLYNTIKSVNRSYLLSLWRRGILYPSDNFEKSHVLMVGPETTTNADRKAGRVNVIVGINPQYPSEFIYFRIGIYDGVSSVEEIGNTLPTSLS